VLKTVSKSRARSCGNALQCTGGGPVSAHASGKTKHPGRLARRKRPSFLLPPNKTIRRQRADDTVARYSVGRRARLRAWSRASFEAPNLLRLKIPARSWSKVGPSPGATIANALDAVSVREAQISEQAAPETDRGQLSRGDPIEPLSGGHGTCIRSDASSSRRGSAQSPGSQDSETAEF